MSENPIITDAAQLPLVLTPKDVQAILGIGRDAAYDLMHQPGFPLLRVGRKFRVRRDALLTWLARQEPSLTVDETDGTAHHETWQ